MSDIEVQELSRVWGDRLLDEIGKERVRAWIVKRWRSSQVLTFRIVLWRAKDLEKVQTPKMERRLAHVVGRDGDLRMTCQSGGVLVEIGLPARFHEPLPWAALRPGRGLRVPLGHDMAGRTVYVDLADSDTPHGVVASTTGRGKSVLLQVLAAGLVRQNTPAELGLILIDGKSFEGQGLMPLAGVSHLSHPVITDAQHGAAALTGLVAELERRAAGWSQRIVCLIDEVQAILDETGGVRGPAAQAIVRLTELGRKRGISLMLATQHPVADVLGGSLAKANLPLRLIGKVTDAQASTNATGQAGAEAHKLRGKGDWLKVVSDDVRRFQVALPSDEDLARLPRGETVPSMPELVRMMDQDIVASVMMPGEMIHPSQAPTPVEGGELDWAMANGRFIDGRTMAAGVGAIKGQFNVGTKRAERIRDLAQATLDAAHERMVPSQASHPSPVGRQPAVRVVGGASEPWDAWDGEDIDA